MGLMALVEADREDMPAAIGGGLLRTGNMSEEASVGEQMRFTLVIAQALISSRALGNVSLQFDNLPSGCMRDTDLLPRSLSRAQAAEQVQDVRPLG